MIAGVDGLAVLGFSAPVTAAVIGVVGVLWKRSGPRTNGGEEFGRLAATVDALKDDVGRRLDNVERELHALRNRT